MGHEFLMADLQRGVLIHFCFSLIQDCLKVVFLKFMRRTANGLPQACSNPATISGIELQGSIHDGFIGGDHEGIMGAKNGWGNLVLKEGGMGSAGRYSESCDLRRRFVANAAGGRGV